MSVRTVSGVLKFADDQLPDGKMKIQLCEKRWWGFSEVVVGEAKADKDGKFTVTGNFSDDLVVRVIEKRRPFARQGFHISEEVVVQSVPVRFGTEAVELMLTYMGIPKDLTVVQEPAASHSQSWDYLWRLVKAQAGEMVKKGVIAPLGSLISLERVQALYSSMGTTYQNRAATPANLIEELLFDICAIDCEQTKTQVIWRANWDGCHPDIAQSLANVTVIAQKSGDELHLESIEIKFPEDADPRKITPESANIDWAIFVARSMFCLKGEAEVHLAEGHLLPGLVATAFFKHMKPENPLFEAVAPHLGELAFINWKGSQGVIFGKGSVLEISALTEQDVADKLIAHMKLKGNYQTDIPRGPINSQDHRARVSQMHYNLLHKFFTDLIRDNLNAIVECKEELYRWVHSVHSKLPEIPECVTSTSGLSEEEKTNLTRFLTWVVHKTTFLHWAAHSRQHLLTDIGCTSLAMQRFGLDEQGKLAFGGNTDPQTASKQIFMARTLLNFEGGRFTANPYGDINPTLLERVRVVAKQYKPYDVGQMFFTTQI